MKIIEAIDLVSRFNREPIDEIDWSLFFEGEKLEECIKAFSLTGLLNTDLLTSDYPYKYGLNRKYKFTATAA